MKKRTWMIIGGGVLIIIIALVVGKNSRSDVDYQVEISDASYRQIIETVSASGKVQPEVEVNISPDVSGEVIELQVREGEKVEKGQLLAKINPDIYVAAADRMEATLNTSRANLANSKARLAQAEAQFINSEASFNRNEKLYKQKAISEADFDAARSSYEVAKAEVKAAEQSVEAANYNVRSAQASVKEARDNLNRTTIYAPQNGTVSSLSVEQGERVVGTAQMAGTEMMRIADLTHMEVNVEVNESDIVRVSLGDRSFIEVDAYLDRKFEGRVTEIANSANSTGMNTDMVTTFNVKIRILRTSYEDLLDKDNPHLSPFRPGMSANVEIETAIEDNVLTVPIQAVTTREDTNKTEEDDPEKDERLEVVFLYKDGKAVMQPVKTGAQDSRYIAISEGLEDSLQVISGPYSILAKKLDDGDIVEEKSESEKSGFGPPKKEED